MKDNIGSSMLNNVLDIGLVERVWGSVAWYLVVGGDYGWVVLIRWRRDSYVKSIVCG